MRSRARPWRVRAEPALCLALLLLGYVTTAQAIPPPERLAALQHGINLTNWFRFPASLDPARLRGYLSDAQIGDLRRAGFDFVRLAVQPEFLRDGDRADPLRVSLLLEAIHRLQRQGLAVTIAPHFSDRAVDRAGLLGFWRVLAPALAGSDPKWIFPEILNEPVFAQDAAGWAALQALVLAEIRQTLPRHTLIVTGQDWGSIAGLLALRPVADANVIYSVHFYDPPELTSLAAYRPGLDRAALARLPFPMAEGCDQTGAPTGANTDQATAELIGFVCAMHWDAAGVGRRIGEAGAWARRHQAAVLLGEFGASVRLNAPARLAWLTAVRAAAEQAGIGWALWGYDDGMGLNVPHSPGLRPVLDEAVLRALGIGDHAVSDAPAPARSPRRSAR